VQETEVNISEKFVLSFKGVIKCIGMLLVEPPLGDLSK